MIPVAVTRRLPGAAGAACPVVAPTDERREDRCNRREALGGLLSLLRRADQRDRAEIYTRIGLQMQYRPGTETVLAAIRSTTVDRVPVMCPEPNATDIHTVIAFRELVCGSRYGEI